MFNSGFNNNFQNTFVPSNANLEQNPYLDKNMQRSYPMVGNNGFMPNTMDQNLPYLSQTSTSIPTQNIPTYAEGGEIKSSKQSPKNSPYSLLAEMVRQQGKGEDTILAHINPLEAMILKNLGGSGTINPKTGLPQFGLFNNPGKWLKSVAGPAVGTVLGNMILPGIGGIIGGGLGGAAGSKLRGRKDSLAAGLRGAAIGAMAPTIADLAGSGLEAVGGKGVGNYLTNYGNKNAIMSSIDRMFGLGSPATSSSKLASSIAPFALPAANNTHASNRHPTIMLPGGSPEAMEALEEGAEPSFMSSLTKKSKNFLTDPANLLTLASVGSQFINRPKEKKEKSPEQIASEHKRLEKALRLTTEERAMQEADLLAAEQMKRRIARNKFLPEERLGNIEPLYVRTNTPEEYKLQKKWLNYYNNPDFTGNPTLFKKGGATPMPIEEIEINTPQGLGYFLAGSTGGQDDKIPREIRPNSYVMDASTVSDAGDGNSIAGAENINALLSDGEMVIPPEKVAQFAVIGAKNLDKFRINLRKHKRGGKTNLPPKAKSLTSYIRG